jgi:R3H domain
MRQAQAQIHSRASVPCAYVQLEREQRRAAKRAAKQQASDAGGPVSDDAEQRYAAAPSPEPKECHIRLPPSLTPKQRALVHEAAEAAGLQHESRGEDADRCLQVGDFSLAMVRRLQPTAGIGVLQCPVAIVVSKLCLHATGAGTALRSP